MDSITRHVKDIGAADRQAIEHLLGQPLGDHQQLVIQLLNPPRANANTTQLDTNSDEPSILPEWCHVYAGLSEGEIEALEQSVLTRVDLYRQIE